MRSERKVGQVHLRSTAFAISFWKRSRYRTFDHDPGANSINAFTKCITTTQHHSSDAKFTKVFEKITYECTSNAYQQQYRTLGLRWSMPFYRAGRRTACTCGTFSWLSFYWIGPGCMYSSRVVSVLARQSGLHIISRLGRTIRSIYLFVVKLLHLQTRTPSPW